MWRKYRAFEPAAQKRPLFFGAPVNHSETIVAGGPRSWQSPYRVRENAASVVAAAGRHAELGRAAGRTGATAPCRVILQFHPPRGASARACERAYGAHERT